MVKIREKELSEIERHLGITFPPAYRQFLLERGSAVVMGNHIFGIPQKEGEMSVAELTELLRSKCPDLPQSYVAIALKDESFLCFDATQEEEDPSLLDVVSEKGGRVEVLPITFKEYIRYFEDRERTYKAAYRRLKNRKREFEHAFPDTVRKLKRLDPTEEEKRELRQRVRGRKVQYTLEPRSQDWHPRFFRMMDAVTIIYCFRYSHSHGCLEVDVFWAPEDKRCEPDDIIKWAAIAIFAEAINLGGSADVIFTRDKREKEDGYIPRHLIRIRPDRVPTPAPLDLADYAKRQGVNFAGAEEGRIYHQEAIELWWKILGLSEKAAAIAENLEKAGWFSREWLCYIIAQNVWSPEEADWILQNAPRPEAVLFATDPPEHRLPFAETLAWGRAALIMSRFVRKVVLDFTGGYAPEEDIPTPDYKLVTDGRFQTLCFEESWKIPWMHPKHRKELEVFAGRPVLILCRPRCPLRPKWDKILFDHELRMIAEHPGDFAFRCLIFSMEFEESPLIEDFIREAEGKGVTVLFGQRALQLYEDDVMERFHKIRVQRRLPSRILPMRLVVLEVPGHLWIDKKVGLDMMSRTAETFGRWIGKQMKVKRARFEFTTHNEAVERISINHKEARGIVELTAEESEQIQTALFPRDEHYPDVSFSYVKPEKMAAFVVKLPTLLQERLNVQEGSGLVFVPIPYQKVPSVAFASRLKPKETRQGDVLSADFPLMSPDPSNMAIGWWKKDIQIFQDRLEKCLRRGNPLPVSFLRMSLFADMLRPHLWISSEHKLEKPIRLRIVYQDGSEGEPFSLFDLPPIEKPKGLFKLGLGTISARHQTTDFAVAGYIMINMEVQFRKDSGASEQEAFAYHRTLTFVGNLLKAAKGEDLDAIKKLDPVYDLLIWGYKIGSPPARGLELHLFQATGLEPITVGVWRGLRELIRRHRGEMMVVPRVLAGSTVGLDPNLEGEERRRAVEETFKMGQPWY